MRFPDWTEKDIKWFIFLVWLFIFCLIAETQCIRSVYDREIKRLDRVIQSISKELELRIIQVPLPIPEHKKFKNKRR